MKLWILTLVVLVWVAGWATYSRGRLFALPAGDATTEIRIGTFLEADKDAPAAIVTRVMSAYFKRLDQAGGLLGRSINFVSYDTEGEGKKALDLARRLFEVDRVSLFASIGGKDLDAVAYYLRFRQVPLMYEAQDSLSDDVALKATALGEYIANNKPDAKIALIFETGQAAGAVDSFFFGLGTANARRMITNMVGSADWQGNLVERVSGSSANFLVILGSAQFQSATIKQAAGLQWHPIFALTHDAADLHDPAIMVTNLRPIDLTGDEVLAWQQLRTDLDPSDATSRSAIEGFLQAKSIVRILRDCLPDLTSGCLRRTYASEKDYRIDHDYAGAVTQIAAEALLR